MSEFVYLVLENGRSFRGLPFGAKKDGVVGEVVFTTGMTGYLETLSDPGYHGQIVVQAFPLVGNYGAIRADFESDSLHPGGYVVRECCDEPSNFRSEGTLGDLLAKHGIPGIRGVDTRALILTIREAGVMNGIITDDPSSVDFESLRSGTMENPVAFVSPRQVETRAPSRPEKFRVALWDFGAKESIVRRLLSRGCTVFRVPHDARAEEIAALEPDGIVLSNGPGDPAENAGTIEDLRRLMARNIPTCGICLGHQILALAAGCRTAKLKYGHRGANQPVRDTKTGFLTITTQNHGYTVLPESVPQGRATVRYVNANDGTCEGLDYVDFPAFGVQFHPESAVGPQGTVFLFERFMRMMSEGGR